MLKIYFDYLSEQEIKGYSAASYFRDHQAPVHTHFAELFEHLLHHRRQTAYIIDHVIRIRAGTGQAD